MNFDFYTIDKEITLFYSLSTGKIKQYCTGIQTMDFFGEDKEDYNYGVLVVENDSYITKNIDKFIVENGELVIVPQTISNKYRIKY